MRTSIEINSPNDPAGAETHSEKRSSWRQEILSGESMVLEDNYTSKAILDSDVENSWFKLENHPMQFIIHPMSCTSETPTSPTSICSDESSEGRTPITSVPMIRENVQSYIGWTSIDAPFANETVKLPSQLSPVTSSFDASSPSATLDNHKTSLDLPTSPSHTPLTHQGKT